MKALSIALAKLIEKVAEMGAGVASAGFGYEPKMPKSLKK